tara:strand:+ start:363 stop:1145 length:783 start_codon:yes stop_codon:yes gene_type:complete
MKILIKKILREQTDPTFGDRVWDAVKEVGKSTLKHNALSWLIRKVVGATPTKARLIFPKEGWETTAMRILEQIGIVTGTYKTLGEANNFFKDLKENGIVLEELLIGSHGSPGNLLITQQGGRKGRTKTYRFRTDFLKYIKPVVNSNTKVYFTACRGAEKLTMLKEAANYLGCECYACMGKNAFSFGCEDSNWSCIVSDDSQLNLGFAKDRSEKERELFTGIKNGYESSKAYTNMVNDLYVEHGICKEQPNVPFNWVTLFS